MEEKKEENPEPFVEYLNVPIYLPQDKSGNKKAVPDFVITKVESNYMDHYAPEDAATANNSQSVVPQGVRDCLNQIPSHDHSDGSPSHGKSGLLVLPAADMDKANLELGQQATTVESTSAFSTPNEERINDNFRGNEESEPFPSNSTDSSVNCFSLEQLFGDVNLVDFGAAGDSTPDTGAPLLAAPTASKDRRRRSNVKRTYQKRSIAQRVLPYDEQRKNLSSQKRGDMVFTFDEAVNGNGSHGGGEVFACDDASNGNGSHEDGGGFALDNATKRNRSDESSEDCAIDKAVKGNRSHGGGEVAAFDQAVYRSHGGEVFACDASKGIRSPGGTCAFEDASKRNRSPEGSEVLAFDQAVNGNRSQGEMLAFGKAVNDNSSCPLQVGGSYQTSTERKALMAFTKQLKYSPDLVALESDNIPVINAEQDQDEDLTFDAFWSANSFDENNAIGEASVQTVSSHRIPLAVKSVPNRSHRIPLAIKSVPNRSHRIPVAVKSNPKRSHRIPLAVKSVRNPNNACETKPASGKGLEQYKLQTNDGNSSTVDPEAVKPLYLINVLSDQNIVVSNALEDIENNCSPNNNGPSGFSNVTLISRQNCHREAFPLSVTDPIEIKPATVGPPLTSSAFGTTNRKRSPPSIEAKRLNNLPATPRRATSYATPKRSQPIASSPRILTISQEDLLNRPSRTKNEITKEESTADLQSEIVYEIESDSSSLDLNALFNTKDPEGSQS